MEVCSGEMFKDRDSFDYNKFTALKPVYEGKKRVCWNSWIAPHNLEGFMLIHGDLVTKEGKVDLARRIYKAVKKTPDYPKWPQSLKTFWRTELKMLKKMSPFLEKASSN